MNELGIDLTWHQVRWYLKEQKNLSYKKGWVLRIDLDKNWLSYLRILYSIRLVKQLNEDILMINIDEVSFSPEALNCRSWFKKGINSEIFSQKYSGAVSVILAISSARDYIAATLKERLNSEGFIEFMRMVEFWVDIYWQKENKRILVLLNNYSIHRSKMAVEYMKTTKFRYIFLPHYTPSLAPVELIFEKIKRKIADIDTQIINNWKSSKGNDILKQSLSETKPYEIMK